MEVKELKIGNFIYDNDGIVSKITGLTPFDHSTRCDEIEGCLVLIDIYRPNGEISKGWECDSNTIKPIEITEEWLIKFGFTNDNNESWFWSFDFNDKQETFKVFPLTAGGEPMGLWGIVGCPQLVKKIQFVHQLQNIFHSLVGTELTIN